MLAPLPFAFPYSASQDPLNNQHSHGNNGGGSERPRAAHLHVPSSLGTSYHHDSSHGRQQTRDPTVTGTSILAFTYADGVMLAGDTLGSYGSMARFKNLDRIRPLGAECVIGATGEFSDFQYLHREMDFIVRDDKHSEDGHVYAPKALFSVLTRIMYNRRTYKMDPLYNSFVVAGYRDNEPFLGVTDLNGTNYTESVIATGYGNYLAMPILRKEHRADLSHAEAKALMEKCLKVLFYRDARTINKVQIATVTKDGPSVSQPYELDTDWRVGKLVYAPPVRNAPDAGEEEVVDENAASMRD